MRILLSADWHNPPDGLRDYALKFLALPADARYALGDTLDFYVNYWWDYFDSLTIREMKISQLFLVPGNHDPLSQLRKLLGDKVLGWEVRLGVYHLSHGHRWSDWALWRYLTPFLLKVAPSIYIKFAGKPSHLKNNKEAYDRMVHFMWSNALRQSKGRYIPIFGHSHADAFLADDRRPLMVNIGSLRDDGTYLVIEEDKIWLERL